MAINIALMQLILSFIKYPFYLVKFLSKKDSFKENIYGTFYSTLTEKGDFYLFEIKVDGKRNFAIHSINLNAFYKIYKIPLELSHTSRDRNQQLIQYGDPEKELIFEKKIQSGKSSLLSFLVNKKPFEPPLNSHTYPSSHIKLKNCSKFLIFLNISAKQTNVADNRTTIVVANTNKKAVNK